MKKFLLAFLCIAILAVPAFGEVYVGGQLGSTSTANSNVDFKAPPFKGTFNGVTTDWSGNFGVVLGYNFEAQRYNLPAWMDYVGVAMDFSYNGFNQANQIRSGTITPPFVGQVNLPQVTGTQYALAFLARVHYPFMKDDTYPRGRLFPFVAFGPGIVWTTSDFTNYGGGSQTSTDVAMVVDAGLDYFVVPNLSIGPVFRYRHVWGPSFNFQRPQNYIDAKSNLDQFSAMLRVAYHF